jgi:hypothetical protein
MRAQLAVIALALATRVAAADPQSDKLFDEGRQLLDQGKAVEACEKFDKAIQIDPTAAGTMLNLGLCNEKLEKYATALYWFRKAQTAAAEARPRLPQHEQVAKQHTVDLAEKVATIVIAFSGGEAPSGAKLKIDQREVNPADYNHAEVDPGHHVLDAGAHGMKNVHQEFDIQGKGGQTLTVSFVQGSNAIVIDNGRGRRRAAIYTAIGGGALWVVDGILALHWRSVYNDNKNDAMNGVGGGGTSCSNVTDPNTALGRACGARDAAHVWGSGLFIAGAVAIAGASVLYFTAPQPEKIDQTVWTPTVDRHGIGVAVSGRF